MGGHALGALSRRIIACHRCPRLRRHCAAIARDKKREFRDHEYWGRPVPGWGDPRARVLVVGLAPAAHGANRTGRMFTGDSSGDWLYAALHRFGFASRPDSRSRDDGLALTDCYITAAARCAPPANKPTAVELARCRPYLEAELRLLRHVEVVIVLGRIAHEAFLRASGWWDRLPPRERPRFAHGAVARLPNGTVLVSSYHPSRQNTNTGRLTRAMWHAVWRRVGERLDGKREAGSGKRETGSVTRTRRGGRNAKAISDRIGGRAHRSPSSGVACPGAWTPGLRGARRACSSAAR